ncbi:hypothetical protein [Gordonia sp. X0973]|uniref:hypothetical protein n=1 Tax=Gordonia sp. X0973 TaxID=2742602 RepID=UPI0026575AAD|nr:hypothetical protein [Gordonia sp. X0973]
MRISRTPPNSAWPPADSPPWTSSVLEVSGGALRWELLEPSAPPRLLLWAPEEAGWLWRIVGETGHVEVATTETAEVTITAPAELDLLRRLAWGHWLRRWWPASSIDAIDELPSTVLDVEVALLTVDAEGYFDDDGFDGDPHAVLAAHDEATIDALATHADPRVRELRQRWFELRASEATDDLGVPSGSVDDYALAAGAAASGDTTSGIAHGRGSLPWEAAPAHVFDAAEDTVRWTIDAAPNAVAEIEVALLPGRTATPLRVGLSLPDPPLSVHAELTPDGRAQIPLPLTAAQAWAADWSSLTCTVGGVDGRTARGLREQVRGIVRQRISGADGGIPLFVAEQLLADADY